MINLSNLFSSQAVAQRCSVKKVFLEISQNSQESTCARLSFLVMLQAWGLGRATLLKKRFWHRCFPVNFAKFLRTPFFTEHLWWLLLFYITFLICLTTQGITVSISLFWSSKFIFYTFESYFIVNIECVWASFRIKVTFNNFISFKVGLSSSTNICDICLIESPLKMMKNAFCFILKALLVLKILSRLFGHVGKTAWLER